MKELPLPRVPLVAAFLLVLALFPCGPRADERTVLKARSLEQAPALDGTMDELWSRVEPVTISVQPVAQDVGSQYENFRPERRTQAVDVTLRAMVSGDVLYVLARWPDSTESVAKNPWVWDAEKRAYREGGGNEDRFALLLPMGPNPTDCMVSGIAFVGDLWYWKAARGNAVGYADDQSLRLGLKEFRGAEVLHGPGGKVSYGKRFNDAGEAAYAERKEAPIAYEGDQLPRYVLREPTGSRADIRAKAVWQGGVWTLEMARALDTGDPEGDRALRRGDRLQAAAAVFDDAGDFYHATSGLFTLELE